MRSGALCVCVCVRTRLCEGSSGAMLHCLRGLRRLRLELNVNVVGGGIERERERKEAPQPVSLHQS